MPYTQIPLSYGKGTPCYAVYCILYAVYCMLYAVYCMLYAVLFTKIMQLPEFMHLRAFWVCVFTEKAANVWGLGMGLLRELSYLGCILPPGQTVFAAARSPMSSTRSTPKKLPSGTACQSCTARTTAL